MLNFAENYSNNMVFAHDQDIIVQGKSDLPVTVTFAGINVKCVPDNYVFTAKFPSMPYGGPFELGINNGKEEIILKNVYVGLVLLMAGQSNQQFKFKEGTDEYSEYYSNSNIRMFSTNKIAFFDADLEHFRASNGWVELRKEDIKEWPSLVYQVSRAISETNPNIVIGIITAYQGASVIESWIPESLLIENKLLLPDENKHPDHTDKLYRIWNRNGLLYDVIFSQIMPLTVNAICWYQGESDTSYEEGLVYDRELKLLVDTFRKDLRNNNIPFIFVEIANLDCRNDEGWKAIQDAQERASKLIENSYLVDARDVSDTFIIHPPRKRKLAIKIANVISNLENF